MDTKPFKIPLEYKIKFAYEICDFCNSKFIIHENWNHKTLHGTFCSHFCVEKFIESLPIVNEKEPEEVKHSSLNEAIERLKNKINGNRI